MEFTCATETYTASNIYTCLFEHMNGLKSQFNGGTALFLCFCPKINFSILSQVLLPAFLHNTACFFFFF